MQKVPDTKDNLDRCVCPQCPTYLMDKCAKEKDENIYCAREKSQCDLLDRGCICGSCPLWDEHKLSKGYFCLY